MYNVLKSLKHYTDQIVICWPYRQLTCLVRPGNTDLERIRHLRGTCFMFKKTEVLCLKEKKINKMQLEFVTAV